MKEPRLDFSDYSAQEQEADVRKARFRQVYLMRVDGEWGHVAIVNGEMDADFHKGDLTETYLEIKAQYPNHQVRVIRNYGLENYLRDIKPKLLRKKQKEQKKELPIPFKEYDR